MLWRTLPKREEEKTLLKRAAIRPNHKKTCSILWEKNAPLLESWQREILRIVRKVSQYFYPQKQTQVMNEGWANPSGTIPSLTICMMKGK
ncbi:SpoVR family protein [Escherichia coli]|uniref:SpoVR family protein n=1 Tax=Escherichia coli TaxID=562 RepID=A0A376P4C0_ECOLX|nr:SpoVR family protein [Escherichia coli]